MLTKIPQHAEETHALAADRWKPDNVSYANYQKEPFMFQSYLLLPCCAPSVPLSALSILMTAAMESWALSASPSQVQTGPTSSWSPGCTEMFDTQQQETCRATPERKGEVKTHSLLCHSVSPVSKYCSLHLNLIGLSLGIHYLHLLLVSPYQQMPT